MLRLLRRMFSAIPPRPGTVPALMIRLVSPLALSTTITSAPRSARIWVAYGPMITELRSRIR
jgi:hypothetical protein